MNRLLLVPGYLEDCTIFDTLRPWLPATEVLALELAPEFAQWHPRPGAATVVALAEHLARCYRIGPTDALLGHSMGGWIAAHLRALTGASAVQLSSFTDQGKIVARSRHPLALALYAWLGVGGSP